jgi:hypothetical protein
VPLDRRGEGPKTQVSRLVIAQPVSGGDGKPRTEDEMVDVVGGVLLPRADWDVVHTFLGDPGRWLPLPATEVDEDRWLVTVRGGPVLHETVVEVGDFVSAGMTHTRPVRWMPGGGESSGLSSALPRFDGRIELHLDPDRTSLLTLSGWYDPPLGRWGTMMDRAVLHGIADGTVRGFAGSVADRLVREHVAI